MLTNPKVKGGGHATNPGFSSSPGVLISMSRFNNVTFNAAAQTATVGAGSIWDAVHLALEKHGVSVVGGRTEGVGVAGFTLGGGTSFFHILLFHTRITLSDDFSVGYSWKSNQHGLTLDNVVAFELVLPNGQVATISGDSDPDLFFALRGGGNNFVGLHSIAHGGIFRRYISLQGIVTNFIYKTYPQTLVWVSTPEHHVDAFDDSMMEGRANRV